MIEMKNITKIFGTLKANDDISLTIKPGEIHALLGENGAGKSTIMSILFGLYQPTSGTILIDNNEVNIANPNIANQHGIGMVHQHFKLVDTFTVLDNIILGAEDTKNGFITRTEAREKINSILSKYNFKLDLDKTIEELTVGEQQKVEIVKMLYRDSKYLIFDEPTAVLTPQEIQELIAIMQGFKKEGKAIILITHKLNEIKAAADICTVLRRGKLIATVEVSKTSTDEMAAMMVGRNVNFNYNKSKLKVGNKVLEINNLSLKANHGYSISNVTFDVKAGEIVGLCGIDGNGQTELVEAIAGLRPVESGSIILNEVDITRTPIKKRYDVGLSHIPEDRHKHGLVLDYSLAFNLALHAYYDPKFQKRGILNRNKINENAELLIKSYDIRSAAGSKTIARSMSGGNQQKAIIAREITRNHNLLIAVQPTRGLDVGAIEFIHNEIIKEREEGKAVLLVSLELDEILDLSDRILVIYEGKIVAQLDSKKATPELLGIYMSGSQKGEVK